MYFQLNCNFKLNEQIKNNKSMIITKNIKLYYKMCEMNSWQFKFIYSNMLIFNYN